MIRNGLRVISKGQKGFTLVEVLIAVALIGLISGSIATTIFLVFNVNNSSTAHMTAVKQGILLDPVYTGKTMVGLMDLVHKEYFKKDDCIVFIHTGGLPTLFPYRKKLLEFIREGKYSYYMDSF